MSRSYKHTPHWRTKKHKEAKKYANRIVRRTKINEKMLDHNQYKKMYESWDICDWYSLPGSFNTYYKHAISLSKHFNEEMPSKKEIKKEYDKYYRRK